MKSHSFIWNDTGKIALGQGVGIALMCGIFAVIGKFDWTVLLGGLAGALVATGNFFFMAMAATLAADKAQQQDVEGGKKLMQGSYPIRILVLAGVLILCGKSGYFDILALVIPLLFVRPTLTISEFFQKKGS